jgi:hypothetical protein
MSPGAAAAAAPATSAVMSSERTPRGPNVVGFWCRKAPPTTGRPTAISRTRPKSDLFRVLVSGVIVAMMVSLLFGGLVG